MPRKTGYMTAQNTANATDNGWRLLDRATATGSVAEEASPTGTVRCLIHAGAEIQLVADSITAPGATPTNRFNITGSVSAPIDIEIDPCKTWVRLNANTGTTTVYWMFMW